MDLFELTKTLIDIPSITGKEQKVISFLKRYLKDAGFEVELQELSDGRCNIFARLGKPTVVLTTHMDTVPPLIQSGEDDVYIYGRGACDAKGILAAQIKAAESLAEEKVGDFGLLFIVGEEKGSDGAHAANNLSNQCRFFINGEPTDNKMAIGSKGAIRVELETTGKSAHSAYPEMGESAILKLLDVLEDLRNVNFPEHEILGQTSMNVGVINGGTQANVIAEHAYAEIMLRIATNMNRVKRILENVVNRRADIHYKFESDPIRLRKIDNFETTIVSFVTDISILTNWGEPFLLGPGSVLNAHSAQERVRKNELTRGVELYIKLVKLLKEIE